MIKRLDGARTSEVAAPASLAELRVAAVAGSEHLACIERVCTAVDVIERDWESGPEAQPPHMLLIESSGLRAEPSGGGPLDQDKVERVGDLLGWARSLGVPTALWETALHQRILTPTELMAKADHIFVADPEAGEALTEELDGRRPIQLPLAAQVVPKDVPGFRDRSNEVVFLGRWPDDFSGRLEKELESILDAAADHGLTVFESERDSGKNGLPERFSSLVKPVPAASKAVEEFARSRVVVGLDPGNEGRLMIPQITFEALAAGSAVIAPNHTATRRLLRYAALIVEDRAEAAEALDRVLGSEEAWNEVSDFSRRAVLHAHTYSHRLATIASATGLRLVPSAGPATVAAAS